MLPLGVLGFFALFYLFFHYHSYYPYTVAPALAILVGLVVARRRLGALVAVVLGLLNVPLVLATLGAVKYERGEFAIVARWAREQQAGAPTFFLSGDAHAAAWTILAWYGGGPVLGPRDVARDKDGCLLLPYQEALFTLPPVPLPDAPAQSVALKRWTPVVGGLAIEVEPVSPHLFSWSDFRLRRVGSWNLFTWLVQDSGRVLHASRLPAHLRVCTVEGGLTLAPAPGQRRAPPPLVSPTPSPTGARPPPSVDGGPA
jgi:hypothetical protein